MTDRIDFGGEPWKAIPRSTLRDARLSPQAKGGLVSLLSHEEGWIRSALAMLQRENKCGRERARSIIRELIQTGYVETTYKREGGKIVGRNYVIRATPNTPYQPEMALGSDETPKSVEPTSEKPTSVSPYEVVEALDVEALDVEPKDAKQYAAPNGASVDNAQTFVPDRWPYFLVQLADQDPSWAKVTVGACIKIARETSTEAVSTALSFAATSAPVLTGSAYGWLEATAKGLHEATSA